MCSLTFPQTVLIQRVIFDTHHTIPIFLIPFPPRGTSWVLLSAENSVELKVEPYFVTSAGREKNNLRYDIKMIRPGAHHSCLREATLLGNRCYRDLYQSALIMGIYICLNNVRDCLEYFHLVATGCPHLQSKYAMFSVGYWREKKTLVFFLAFHMPGINLLLNSQPGHILYC